MSTPHPSRNPGIDCLRLVAAFAVIVLHIDPTTAIAQDLRSSMFLICRFAVPVFFLIAGYFAAPTISRGNLDLVRFVSRPIKIFFIGSLLYLPFQIGRMGIEKTWAMATDIRVLAAGTCFHLWFLSSLAFGFLIVGVLIASNSRKLLSFLSATIISFYAILVTPPGLRKRRLNFRAI